MPDSLELVDEVENVLLPEIGILLCQLYGLHDGSRITIKI